MNEILMIVMIKADHIIS